MMRIPGNGNAELIAVIATALHLYLGADVHDSESGVITIQRKDSQWNNPSFMFRRKP